MNDHRSGVEKGTGRMRRSRRWLVLLVLAALIAGAGALRALLREVPEVDYVRVGRGTVRELVSGVTQGTVTARRLISVPLEVSSRVVRLPLAEGARVEKGDLIAELDDREARQLASIRRAQRDAAAAQAKLVATQLATAQREAVRGERLAARNAISAVQLERLRDARAAAEGQAALAAANLRAADAGLGQAALMLERHRIYAPISGVLVRLDLTVGELAAPTALGAPTGLGEGTTPLQLGAATQPPIQIVDPASIYVEAQIDERDLDRVHLGQPVELGFEALGDRLVAGELSVIRPLVEVLADRSRRVTTRIAPPAEILPDLRVGMGADVEIVVDERSGVLRLPPVLVLQRSGRHEVVVLDGNRARIRQVGIGLASWRFTEITSGLQEGETVLWPPEEGDLQDGDPVLLGRDRSDDDGNSPATASATSEP
jgi:HlyD family secretion protein